MKLRSSFRAVFRAERDGLSRRDRILDVLDLRGGESLVLRSSLNGVDMSLNGGAEGLSRGASEASPNNRIQCALAVE